MGLCVIQVKIEMAVSLVFVYRSANFWYRCLRCSVLNNLLIVCEIARFKFDVDISGFVRNHAHRDFFGSYFLSSRLVNIHSFIYSNMSSVADIQWSWTVDIEYTHMV